MPNTDSRQPRFAETKDLVSFTFTAWEDSQDFPPWGDAARTSRLRAFAREEPILSGALASMVSKAASLDWAVTGGRNKVQRYQELFANASDGDGWNRLIDQWSQDYLCTDMGGTLELARQGREGPVVDLYPVDAACLTRTGNRQYPFRYYPKIGRTASGGIPFGPLDVANIVDLPSTDETKFGLGFSPVSRALKAASVLLALYRYDAEKLADLPMPGLVTMSGILMPELEDAFKLYQAKRLSREQFVFKSLLWFASAGNPLANIKAELIPFSNLPENFDRGQTISLYVYTLALDFGVDAREFWPATQSGATKGEAEVQAQKAKGKGFGRMLTNMERVANWHILPSGIGFGFDRRNDDDDLARAIMEGQHIKNIRALWQPDPGSGEGIISTAEARQLAIERGVLPDWIDPSTYGKLYSMEKAAAWLEDGGAPGYAEMKSYLGPGEDLVRVTRYGATRTVWSSAKSIAVDWPLAGDVNEAQTLRGAAQEHLRAAQLLVAEASDAADD